MREHFDNYNNAEIDVGFAPKLNDVSQKFIDDSVAEKRRLGNHFPLCSMLIEEAIDRVYSTGRIPGKLSHADVYKQRPMKITQKVYVPVKEFPEFNFTGKILGPKGNSLKKVQEATQCRIAIKGRNSIRNREREDFLRYSEDPRHAHLNKDLFLEISVVAPPAESYARIAYALAEIRKYLVPDKNDEVSHEQLREILNDPNLDAEHSKKFRTKAHIYKSILDVQRPPQVAKYPFNSYSNKQIEHQRPVHKMQHYYGHGSGMNPGATYEIEPYRESTDSYGFNYGKDNFIARKSDPHDYYKREAPVSDYPPEYSRGRTMHSHKYSPYYYGHNQ